MLVMLKESYVILIFRTLVIRFDTDVLEKKRVFFQKKKKKKLCYRSQRIKLMCNLI